MLESLNKFTECGLPAPSLLAIPEMLLGKFQSKRLCPRLRLVSALRNRGKYFATIFAVFVPPTVDPNVLPVGSFLKNDTSLLKPCPPHFTLLSLDTDGNWRVTASSAICPEEMAGNATGNQFALRGGRLFLPTASRCAHCRQAASPPPEHR